MPPTPEEQEKIKRRLCALDAWPWSRDEVDRLLAEHRAKRAEAWFRAQVEQELAEHRREVARKTTARMLIARPLSGLN